LSALNGLLKAAEKLLEIVIALNKIDFRSVDHQEIGGGVTEEKMFVGAGDFLNVFERDAVFLARGFFCDARAEDFRTGLEVDDQVGSGKASGKSFVVALVELQFFVVEIDVGEDAIFFDQEVRKDGPGSFARWEEEGLAEAAVALHEEIHLGAEGGAGLGAVEVGEERIIFAVENAAGVKALGEDARESGFTDAQRAFHDDETGRLRSSLGREASALGRRGVVGCHLSVAGEPARGL
jgi:hypothetical protein